MHRPAGYNLIHSSGTDLLSLNQHSRFEVFAARTFHRMMHHFDDNARRVWGKWVSGTNLESVNQLTAQGIVLEEAVTRAGAADRVRDFGFGRATIVKAEGEPGVFTNIEVKFTR